MSVQPNNALEKLIHDVNSKSSSLRNAAVLLRQAPTREADELLPLMVRQAEEMARAIAAFQRERPA